MYAINEPDSVPSSNLVPSAMASGFCQLSFDPYEVTSDDEEYLMPINVAETTPGLSNHIARLLITVRLYSNSTPEAPRN